MESVREKWREFKRTSGFHDVVLFFIFVAISSMFWVILALNDSAQDSFNVRISITNCPDTVTFISDLPEKMHVTIRDKGSQLWRSKYRKPTVNINFKEYASNGVLAYGHSDLVTGLKSAFGQTAQIISMSADSLHLDYTTNPGKRVPVVINRRITAASGSVIEGNLKAMPANVLVYGEKSVIDTVHKAVTEMIVQNNLAETTTVEVKLSRIKDVRIIPSSIKVMIPVEPLVRKSALVTITAVNVPANESLLLFPSKVPVEYYVAMSRLNDDEDANIEVIADFNKLGHHTSKIGLELVRYPERLQNLALVNDSVEYTVVRN